ncbi:MAG: porin [Marinobacter sp.]|nr:porin [Marinobacter sp.]
MSKQGFFNSDEGFNLNQLAIAIEKKVASNVVSRATPTPAPMPDSFDWGFNVTAIYGNDANYFKTYGWDEDLGVNDMRDEDEEAFNVAQAYLELYIPALGGSNLMLGLFHTPLENEIGFPLPAPAPTEFYTHTYSFMHGPAKHAGALYSFKLPHDKGSNIWGLELGAVQGWNNIQDPNNDIDVIANLRWRSSDMSLWIDWENIYGNGANDSFAECGCGSPFPTATTPGEDAKRYQTYLTISKPLNGANRIALEMSYGEQEKSALSTLVNGEPTDAKWYGANLNWYHRVSETTTWNSRFEYFNGEDPAHVVLTGANVGKAPSDWSYGEFYALTSNITWFPSPAVRIRPELRYDLQDSSGPNAFGDGTEDNQIIASLDMTVYF